MEEGRSVSREIHTTTLTLKQDILEKKDPKRVFELLAQAVTLSSMGITSKALRTRLTQDKGSPIYLSAIKAETAPLPETRVSTWRVARLRVLNTKETEIPRAVLTKGVMWKMFQPASSCTITSTTEKIKSFLFKTGS